MTEKLIGNIWIFVLAVWLLSWILHKMFFQYWNFIKIEQKNESKYRIYEYRYIYWKRVTTQEFESSLSAVSYVQKLLQSRNSKWAKVILREATTIETKD